jgi:meso-butanediol dehydrogenase/(S,S)-butanediol dehydrogenase/diacetyl reductase
MIDLGQRTAIVTGGGRGIGRGIALALTGAGADIVIADIDLESAERTSKDISELGRDVLVVRTDVTDLDSARAAVEQTLARFGKVDILVNNAGVVQETVGGDTADTDWERCLGVNLKGIWNMSSAVIPHFREREAGKIVNIASIAGRRGNAGLSAYSASKAAAISLTQSLAASLGEHNINVNAICPGLLWTDMWRKIEGIMRRTNAPEVIDERAGFDAYIESNCPLKREQTPEDIGNAAAFLVSDLAKNITGQSLNVDGGIEMN